MEGGSVINGAFQRENLIDELSLVMAPVTAQPEDKPLFDGGQLQSFALTEAKTLESGVVWLRYLKGGRT